MTEILSLIGFLASTVGSGVLASWLLDQMRLAMPKPTTATWHAARRWRRLLWALLYAPRYARYTVLVLAVLVSLSANIILAAAGGLTPALALDAALAIVASQIRHSFTLPKEVMP